MKHLPSLLVFALLVSLAAAADQPKNAPGTSTYYSTFPATENVPLDPKIQAGLAALPPGTPAEKKTVAELRQDTLRANERRKRMNESVAGVADRKVPGPAGEVPVRIYTPAGQKPFPILLFLHGGGWVRGSIDTVNDFCRSLCHRAGCLVVSVGYRLAPETKFPGGLEDCYAALQWCAAHGDEAGGDGKRLAVSGTSAGGNLTTALALYTRDKGGPKIALQIPLYPVLNYNFDTASYHQNAEGFGLTRPQMMNYWKHYLAREADGLNPYASPLQAKDLAGVAPALIITAQYDVLRDEGEAYAARLHRAGVPVHCTRYLGMTHGFIQSGAELEQARHGLEEMTAALRKAFGQ
jgi:acetyl esterase